MWRPVAEQGQRSVDRLLGHLRHRELLPAKGARGRYFRSWTSTSLTGTWTPLASMGSAPLADEPNVSFNGPAWTNDISHGELVRSGNDQNLTTDPCHLQYVYQGRDPTAGAEYSQLPYRTGLLTQSHSLC
ncbi:non-reducing end alpha-L-arabinofuranosidase family hydrolase [Streptomyces rimosus]|uniref:non-reducing end alpha-L-arabinofuranosidase family hydrolase n=1 Tax=Streptomyces rimosus TaxID=1927 RepID=UPI003796C3E5